MRRYQAGVVVVVLGCSQDSSSESVAAASSSTTTTSDVYGTGTLDGHAIDDIASGPFPDLPEQHASCEERGARFDVVVGPVEAQSFGPDTIISNIGAAARESGMLLLYSSYDPSAAVATYHGLQVGADGLANGSPWTVSGASTSPAAFAHEGGILVTHCTEGASWRAYDDRGSSLGPTITPSAAACSGDVPGGAWTKTGYLIAWHTTPDEACREGCIVLSTGTPNTWLGTSVLQSSFIVTDPISIAVASEAALVVASHVSPADQNELAMSLVDHGGAPLFPPLVYPFESATLGGAQGQAPVAVGVRSDDGFVVFVGGRGAGYGRVQLDAVASVAAEFEDTPLDYEDIFRSDLRVEPRTGGFVVYGPATQRTGAEGMLLLMLDRDGAFESEIFLPAATGLGVVSRQGRTFAAYADGALRTIELGCVL